MRLQKGKVVLDINKPDLMYLQVELCGLKRRVASIEAQSFSEVAAITIWPYLQALYVDACTNQVSVSSKEATLWGMSVSQLTEEMLLDVARACGDPFPWRSFLLVMDLFTSEGYDMGGPTEHLLVLAKNMLAIQGLSKVEPAEVLRSDPNPFSSYQFGG